MLDELRAIYAEVDRLFGAVTCEGSAECCRFGITGREPYPTAVELAELERAVRARGGARAALGPRRLSLVRERERPCPFLHADGRCTVYASRPFGCRTYYCGRATGELPPRAVVGDLARRVADLAARYAPRDPGPRPLSRWAREMSRKE